MLLNEVAGVLGHASAAHPVLAIVLGSLVGLYVLWRLCAFTFLPRLNRDEPRMLPYWIPWLGHTFSMFRDGDGLMANARKHFGDTRKPFSLYVAGERFYVITDPGDVADAYRVKDEFSMEIFVQDIMRGFGTSDPAIKAMSTPPSVSGQPTLFPNPHDKSVESLARSIHIHQLFPGSNLDELQSLVLNDLWHRLQLSTMRAEKFATPNPQAKESVIMPLNTWIEQIFVEAKQRAYFGTQLEEIDSNFARDFEEFDSLSWQILYRYPRVMAPRMHVVRDRMINAMTKYLQLPEEDRSGEVWFTKAAEREMRLIGLEDRDIACLMLSIYWGLNTNVWKMAYWILSFVLRDRALLDAIREETAQFISSDNPDILSIAQCPNLLATFHETLRLSSSSSSVRVITKTFNLGTHTLRAGNRLLIPFRQLHKNEAVFGDHIDEFNHTRFVQNPKLAKSSSWRPFGGGAKMCAGRFMVKHVVLTFVARLLHEYELRPMGGQAFPEMDFSRATLGLSYRKFGSEDFLVDVRPRVKGGRWGLAAEPGAELEG